MWGSQRADKRKQRKKLFGIFIRNHHFHLLNISYQPFSFQYFLPSFQSPVQFLKRLTNKCKNRQLKQFFWIFQLIFSKNDSSSMINNKGLDLKSRCYITRTTKLPFKVWLTLIQFTYYYKLYKFSQLMPRSGCSTLHGVNRIWKTTLLRIVRKGVPAPPLFNAPILWPRLLPPPPPILFKNLCSPSPFFCSTPLLRYFRQSPPHATPSCPNPTNQLSLV